METRAYKNTGIPDPVIRLENLVIGYRKGIKENRLSLPLNCSARAGELVALMGRNGCGKSTLLKTLAGLQDPLAGEIRMVHKSLKDYDRGEFSRLLGFVSTEVIRVQGLRVRDLVSMGRYPHTGWFGRFSEEDHAKTGYAMEITSLAVLAERDLDELSDGERQRAMIARTLAQDTRILVLDEPTAFLDLTHRFEIITLLGKLARQHGKTIVFSSHDLQLSLQEADKIWLMDGQEMAEGAPEDLVLNGQLERGLLPDSLSGGFWMDPRTGNLAIRREPDQGISLDAFSEDLRRWTSRSIQRIGFRVEENKKLPVHVLADERKGPVKWIVEKRGEKVEFNSIYDLSLYLRTNV